MWSWFWGEGGLTSCWDGPENGWMVLGGQVQSQLLERCCRIFCESILSCENKTCPPGYSCSAAYSAAECLPFLCGVWAWSCCQLRTVINTDGDWTTAVLGSCSWFPALCSSACSLSSLWWLPSVKRPTKRMPRRFALDHVTMRCQMFSSLSFFCRGAFVVWKIK